MTATALLETALAKANAEGRNNAGFWLACQLRDARLDRAEAEAVMRDYAAAVPQHGRDPYTAGEALSTLKSIYKTPPREPAPGTGPRRSRKQVKQAKLRQAFALPAPRPADPGPELKKLQDWLAKLQPFDGSPAAAYLEGRAIPPDLARASGAMFHPAWPFKHKADEHKWRRFPAVVYPLRDLDGKLVTASGRRIEDAPDFSKVTTASRRGAGLFWTPGARTDEGPILLVEGPADALSLAACGFPAVARVATDFPPWLPLWAAFRPLDIAWDTDTPGEGATQRVADACARTGAKCYRLRPPEGTGKDWNDALQAIGADALRNYLEDALGSQTAPQLADPAKTAAQEPRIAPAPAPDVSEDLPDLLPGEAEILALLDAGLVTQDAAEAVLSDIFAGRPTPEPDRQAPPPSTQWQSAFADRLPDPEPAAVDELRGRILSALKNTRALRPGETVSDPERYAAREAADALSPYPALAIGARTRLKHLGVSLPAAT